MSINQKKIRSVSKFCADQRVRLALPNSKCNLVPAHFISKEFCTRIQPIYFRLTITIFVGLHVDLRPLPQPLSDLLHPIPHGACPSFVYNVIVLDDIHPYRRSTVCDIHRIKHRVHNNWTWKVAGGQYLGRRTSLDLSLMGSNRIVVLQNIDFI